jgi:hypothetical protein
VADVLAVGGEQETRAPGGGGQGYEDGPDVRKAVEDRAMELAAACYRAQRYDVVNTATTKHYD